MGIERPARQHEFPRHRRADLADQPRDAAPRQWDAEVDLGDGEHGVVGGDAQVARRGEHHAAAHARALDRGDRQGGHAIERLGHPPSEVGGVASVRRRRFGIGELAQVEPRRERPALAGDDHHRRVGRVEPRRGLRDLAQCRRTEWVELGRLVEGEAPDAALRRGIDLDTQGAELRTTAHDGDPSGNGSVMPSTTPTWKALSINDTRQ